MTHDKHRKRAISEEAKRRRLPYQQVEAEQRRNKRDEPRLRQQLTEAATPIVAGWGLADLEDPEVLVADVVRSLVRIAMPRLRPAKRPRRAKWRPSLPVREGSEALQHCVQAIAAYVAPHFTLFDEQIERVEELSVALAPLVAREADALAQARDPDRMRRIVEGVLADEPDDNYLPDSGD